MSRALLSLAPRGQAAEQGISAAEAARHIGEHQTVCGMVVSAHYAARSRGQPTYLNLDRPYPNQIFTAVIWRSDRSKFSGAPDIHYKNKSACITGTIQSYRRKPEIIVRSPEQINLR